jgi:hypothetical protein
MVATVKKIRANPELAYQALRHRVHVSDATGFRPHKVCRPGAQGIK